MYFAGQGYVILIIAVFGGFITVFFLRILVFEDTGYMKFLENADQASLSDSYIHKHLYRFELNTDTLCDKDTFLVICISSDPQHTKVRRLIRNTWGSIREYNGVQVRVVFLLGERLLRTDNETKQFRGLIKEESDKFNDIVLGNFVDTYKNLTYKNVMGLSWVHIFCNESRFIVKTDDDVIVNLFKLIHFLQYLISQSNNISAFMYGKVNRRILPRRNRESKWYMSKAAYSYRMFPPYCNGIGYILSSDVARELYKATAKVPFIPIEDVYIGFCAKVSHVKPTDSITGFDVDFRYETDEEKFMKLLDWSIFINAGYNETRWRNSWIRMISSSSAQHSILYYNALTLGQYMFICLFILILILFFYKLYKILPLIICHKTRIFL